MHYTLPLHEQNYHQSPCFIQRNVFRAARSHPALRSVHSYCHDNVRSLLAAFSLMETTLVPDNRCRIKAESTSHALATLPPFAIVFNRSRNYQEPAELGALAGCLADSTHDYLGCLHPRCVLKMSHAGIVLVCVHCLFIGTVNSLQFLAVQNMKYGGV